MYSKLLVIFIIIQMTSQYIIPIKEKLWFRTTSKSICRPLGVTATTQLYMVPIITSTMKQNASTDMDQDGEVDTLSDNNTEIIDENESNQNVTCEYCDIPLNDIVTDNITNVKESIGNVNDNDIDSA